MKKLIFLMFLTIGITGCSVESVDSTDHIVTADAKFKMQEAQDPMGLYKNNGDLRGTVAVWNDCDYLFIQLTPEDEMPDDIKVGIFSEGVLPSENGTPGELMYDLDDAENLLWSFNIEDEEFDINSSLNIFFKWGNSWLGAEVLGDKNNISNYHIFNFDFSELSCDCEEYFNYDQNEDGTYTFIYIPEEDMDDAELTMTFPQVDVLTEDGWEQNGNGNASAWKKKMDLVACTTYSWTFTLTSDCNGVGQGDANLWTDFKIGEDSKKSEETPNIKANCN